MEKVIEWRLVLEIDMTGFADGVRCVVGEQGARLARSVQHSTLDLRVVRSSPVLDTEFT